MDESAEQLVIVRRIFVAACYRFGSAGSFADFLGISQSALSELLEGRVMPSDDVLLRAVDLIIEELPMMRAEFPPAIWDRVFSAR